MNDKIVIGRVAKAVGIKGEIKILPITDDMRRYDKLKAVYIGGAPYQIMSCRFDKAFVFLKLREINTRDAAGKLADEYVEIDRGDAIIPEGGYLIADDWMLLGQLGWQHNGGHGGADMATLGLSGRYYIIQNGLYLGVGAKYVHADHGYNDLMPGLEVGYAFFLNDVVTIEPAVYYDQSFKNHSDYSKIGFKIGFGIYL